MKKSSLLALSMVSLVALVGCGKSTPKKDASKVVVEDFFSLSFGKDSLKYAEVEAITAGSDWDENGWYEEDALNQYIGALMFTLSDATVTLEDCYNEIFVGDEDTPAEFAAFAEKYKDDTLTEFGPELKTSVFTYQSFIGSYVEKNDEFVGANYTSFFVQGFIYPDRDETSGETTNYLVVIAAGWYFEETF